MKRTTGILLIFALGQAVFGQAQISKGDSLKNEGLLMPALMQYAQSLQQHPDAQTAYKIASTTALMWTPVMRDTSFFFLQMALQMDSSLVPLYDPDFLSLINDPRWQKIETNQVEKYEAKYGPIKNVPYALALFRMIVKDQGFMYAGNIERKRYMENGGYFSTPAIYPILAMEEKNKQENQKELVQLLNKYGWPTTSEVTEYAAAGAALIINHASHEMRLKYFPMLEAAFKNGEAQPLRYAKMKDRILVEEGKEQLYGTQLRFENGKKVLYPIHNPEEVDIRRKNIGLGPLKPYLKKRFNIDWEMPKKNK